MLLTQRNIAKLGATALAFALITIVGAPAAGAQTATPDATGVPVISTEAGNGLPGFNGDNGQATTAHLTFPTGVAEDAAGDVYIADTLNMRIRKVTPNGIITTVAGSGFPVLVGNVGGGPTGTQLGDGGPATKAHLLLPSSPAVDAAGNLYIADSGDQRIRKVDRNGIITTVVGNGRCGDTGDGGPAGAAELCDPTAVAVSGNGTMYIADTGNDVVRKVTPAGIISTFAGTGRFGSTGDGGQATLARLGEPSGVAVDSLHDVYIADSANNKVREVSPTGVISTFAGTGAIGFHGDAGPAAKATLSRPSGVGVDSLGNVYIADSFNFRIRVVTPGGTIFTYAGSGVPGYAGDGGPATNAKIQVSLGDVAVDANNVFFTDTLNERVRRVQGGPPPNISESEFAFLLPLSALVVLGGGGYIIFRRRRRQSGVAVGTD